MSNPQPANTAIAIRAATDGDRDAIWDIFRAVIATGDTYTFDPRMTRDDAMAYWFRTDTQHTYVACDANGTVVGTYVLRPNQPLLGAHVSNAAFMVSPNARRLGVGHAMGEHAIAEATRLGFRAMQFNFVVSTNERAVKLWQQLGFRIIGVQPEAFRHSQLGYVDAYVMHRWLDAPETTT